MSLSSTSTGFSPNDLNASCALEAFSTIAPRSSSTRASSVRLSASSSTMSSFFPSSRGSASTMDSSCSRRRSRSSSSAVRSGKLDGEHGAASLAFAVHRGATAVQLHQRANDGEAEPESAVVSPGAGFRLAEPVEDVRDELGGDAYATVGDAHFGLALGAPQRHVHAALQAA